jgi:ribosomal protein S18 acetylase RimI-like enzyme
MRASIEALTVRETREAADILARAFRDNPLNLGVIGPRSPSRRLRINREGMRSLLPVACDHGVVLGARMGRDLAGALIATEPGGYPLPAPALGARLRTLVVQGPRVTRRWNAVFQALHALHPAEPHAYLGTLGVGPTAQRRGIGSALLAHWLAAVDADGRPAYLETDKAENLAFYAAVGFEVAQETEIFGARVWCMRRPARTPVSH